MQDQEIWNKEVEQLRDTLLRRLFAEWLEAGGTAGIGMGFFYYDGEKFEK